MSDTHDVMRSLYSLPPNYPCIPPVFEIETNQSQSLSYRDADQLYDLLMMEATNNLGKGVIFGLVTTARDFIAELLERRLQEEQDLLKQKNTSIENKASAHSFFQHHILKITTLTSES